MDRRGLFARWTDDAACGNIVLHDGIWVEWRGLDLLFCVARIDVNLRAVIDCFLICAMLHGGYLFLNSF